MTVDECALEAVAPEFAEILADRGEAGASHPASAIRRETVRVAMRDGIHLATDLYLPPGGPAPVIAVRTPYARVALAEPLLTLARHGYVCIAQDCRGTGDSEPDHWDYYVYEHEDSADLVEWIVGQNWCDGFVGALGASYLAT